MYKQLTSEQRYTISVLLQKMCTKKEIAQAIGVSNSTVTRELQRNSSPRGVYKWEKAHRKAKKHKHAVHEEIKKREGCQRTGASGNISQNHHQ